MGVENTFNELKKRMKQFLAYCTELYFVGLNQSHSCINGIRLFTQLPLGVIQMCVRKCTKKVTLKNYKSTHSDVGYQRVMFVHGSLKDRT